MNHLIQILIDIVEEKDDVTLKEEKRRKIKFPLNKYPALLEELKKKLTKYAIDLIEPEFYSDKQDFHAEQVRVNKLLRLKS